MSEQQQATPTREQQLEVASTPEQKLEWLHAHYSGLSAAVDEGVMSLEAALAEATKRGEKPRSGYARKKIAMMRLYAEKERLQADYEALQHNYQEILAELQRKTEECERLQSMYAALASDVQLVLTENHRLLDAIAVLRSSTVQPQPVYPPQPTYPPQRPVTPPGLPSLFSRGLR